MITAAKLLSLILLAMIPVFTWCAMWMMKQRIFGKMRWYCKHHQNFRLDACLLMNYRECTMKNCPIFKKGVKNHDLIWKK